jgi:D-tyrosyl-tRNA(Tyr) deacylase
MFSLLQVGAAILAIPQFTLFAEMRKGRRPEFFSALKPDLARSLFNDFCDLLVHRGVALVERGMFGAAMKVSVENDGPVSIMIDSKDFS